MQKSLAIFLVIALVVAVVSLPTVEGFSGGSGTWKRALQAMKDKRSMCHQLKQFCKRELMEDAEEEVPLPLKE
ncbi:hypothetical protein OS493_005060 [Desmophyllum pertusum]|uniref:Uncharacterized protein n=1 Tax=Desmophyllum pertusum TaxID=174260 RepID=A0A9X0CVB9_9CNID|nr:hypothetical protein OS493_005060 [Desmophyllum pertusum]